MGALLGGLELGPQGSRPSPLPPSPLVTDRRVSMGKSIPSSEHMGQSCPDLKAGGWGGRLGRRELAFIAQPRPRENWMSFLGLAPCPPQHPKDPVLRPAGAPGREMAEGVAIASQQPGRPRPAPPGFLFPGFSHPHACLPAAGRSGPSLASAVWFSGLLHLCRVLALPGAHGYGS